ncbi:DNA primase [Patescibacteria group bacterium]|nr:DNA primase [Patescibacteria group bacterium]
MSQIKKVKEASDIVEIIGERLTLQRAGTNLKTNCPFHGEKTPSFFVNEVMQRYRCFGCGETGDVINFLEKYEGMTFGEALEYLAERAGIKLEKYVKSQQDDLHDQLLDVLDLARQYYGYLLKEHQLGQIARDYLSKRKINQESINLFQLGYSLDEWDGLIKFLHHKKKYSLQILEEAGLVINKGDRYYDRFRGRLMFPLKNHRGQVVGFSGRTLVPGEKDAKYINSPETALYHKSEMLFGFSELYQEIRKKKEIIVCEGEIDVISSAQAHVNNVVAVKGSVLTKEHVKLILRVANKAILSLDRDSAGIEATKRAILIAKDSGLELRVANLSLVKEQGFDLKDPDDIAREQPKLWREAVKGSISVYEFLIQVAQAKYHLDTPEGRRDFIEEVGPILNYISHAVEKDFYIKKVATLLSVKKELVEEDLKKLQSPVAKLAPPETTVKAPKVRLTSQQKLERYLIFLLMNFEPHEIQDKAISLAQFEFSHSELKVFIQAILQAKTVVLKNIVASLPDDVREVVAEISLNPNYESYIKDLNIQTEWESVFVRLQKAYVTTMVDKISTELNELDQKVMLSPEEEQRRDELLRMIVELRRKS